MEEILISTKDGYDARLVGEAVLAQVDLRNINILPTLGIITGIIHPGQAWVLNNIEGIEGYELGGEDIRAT